MRELRLRDGSDGLIVVAHPDDETIWMGGTIMRFSNVRWTIFVLCRESDSDRMPKFRRVAKYYRANGVICDLEDDDIMTIQESIPEIVRIVRNTLVKKVYDYVFFDGYNGQYGHPRHIGVHRAMQKLIANGEVSAPEVYNFAYRADEKKHVSNHPKATHAIYLSRRELNTKRNVVKKLYGFSQNSFENKSCLKNETFFEVLLTAFHENPIII